MARDVDRVIEFINEMEITSIHKRVMINRIDQVPTSEELRKAREQVEAAENPWTERESSDG